MPKYSQSQLDHKYRETLAEIKECEHRLAEAKKSQERYKREGNAKLEQHMTNIIKRDTQELHGYKLKKAELAQEYLRRNQKPPTH